MGRRLVTRRFQVRAIRGPGVWCRVRELRPSHQGHAMHRSLWSCVCLLALLATQGCGRDASPLTPSGASTLRLQDIASSASTPDAIGVLRASVPPADGAGPVITVTGNQTIVNGGT